jgi:hypothetical protein
MRQFRWGFVTLLAWLLLVPLAASSQAAPAITTLSPRPVSSARRLPSRARGSVRHRGPAVRFNGTTATAWSATSITATVPSGATSGDVVVRVSNVNQRCGSMRLSRIASDCKRSCSRQGLDWAPEGFQTPVTCLSLYRSRRAIREKFEKNLTTSAADLRHPALRIRVRRKEMSASRRNNADAHARRKCRLLLVLGSAK